VTTLLDFGGCRGTPFGHFLLGSHNFMVPALGSCVALIKTLEFVELRNHKPRVQEKKRSTSKADLLSSDPLQSTVVGFCCRSSK
jgi:hypothetical protein